jgi:hypothetical protein
MTTQDDVRARIRTSFEREFAGYERLTALAQNLLDSHQDKVGIDSGRPSTAVIAALFAKALKTVHAIYLLAREGYGEDAVDLARTLTNICIDVGYICHDESDARASQWMAMGPIERLKMKRDVSGLTKPEKDQYGQLKTLTKTWTDLGIEGRARQCGRFPMYAMAYRHGSSYSHSDSWSTGQFLTEDTEQLVQAQNQPSGACVDTALFIAAMATYDIVATWGRFYRMDTTAFDHEARSVLDSAFDAGSKEHS